MRQGLKRYLRHTSWPIITATIALMLVGVMAIRASERSDPRMAGLARKQMVYAAAALAAFLLAAAVPYRRVGRLAYPLFALTLGLLVLVLFLPPIRDAHRWINLRLFLVQPSEIAKLSYILLLAWYLKDRANHRRLRGLIVPFVLTLLPLALILREPDLGTALLLLPTLFAMLFVAGAKIRHLLGIVGVAAAGLLLPVPQRLAADLDAGQRTARRATAYWAGEHHIVAALPLTRIKAHQVRRLYAWVHQGRAERRGDERFLADAGYQLYRSKMVLGSGGLTGRSDWNDAAGYFRMLPDDHTDFIFAVVGGQWGFAGCAAVLAGYAVIFLCGYQIASATYDAFGRLLAVGVLALLASQMFINTAMTMGLMPITGMTLPLVSFGGSSLVVNGAALGLLVSVGLRRPILLGRWPFEFRRKKPKPPAPYGPLADGPVNGSSRSTPPTGTPAPCTRRPDPSSRPPSPGACGRRR
jgi:rod shape-determining protein RodA